jgi:hypothetical protein
MTPIILSWTCPPPPRPVIGPASESEPSCKPRPHYPSPCQCQSWGHPPDSESRASLGLGVQRQCGNLKLPRTRALDPLPKHPTDADPLLLRALCPWLATANSIFLIQVSPNPRGPTARPTPASPPGTGPSRLPRRPPTPPPPPPPRLPPNPSCPTTPPAPRLPPPPGPPSSPAPRPDARKRRQDRPPPRRGYGTDCRAARRGSGRLPPAAAPVSCRASGQKALLSLAGWGQVRVAVDLRRRGESPPCPPAPDALLCTSSALRIAALPRHRRLGCARGPRVEGRRRAAGQCRQGICCCRLPWRRIGEGRGVLPAACADRIKSDSAGRVATVVVEECPRHICFHGVVCVVVP